MGRKRIVNESFETSQCRSYNFIALYHDMTGSKAWKKLTGKDIQLYIQMRQKHQRRVTKGVIHDSNANNISMPKAEYLQFMQQRTFEKCIDHLIELGFVKTVKNRYDTRECNIYGFSDMWKKYGTKDFVIRPEYRRTLKQQLEAKKKEQKNKNEYAKKHTYSMQKDVLRA